LKLFNCYTPLQANLCPRQRKDVATGSRPVRGHGNDHPRRHKPSQAILISCWRRFAGKLWGAGNHVMHSLRISGQITQNKPTGRGKQPKCDPGVRSRSRLGVGQAPFSHHFLSQQASPALAGTPRLWSMDRTLSAISDPSTIADRISLRQCILPGESCRA
jgi:hypothetical protein